VESISNIPDKRSFSQASAAGSPAGSLETYPVIQNATRNKTTSNYQIESASKPSGGTRGRATRTSPEASRRKPGTCTTQFVHRTHKRACERERAHRLHRTCTCHTHACAHTHTHTGTGPPELSEALWSNSTYLGFRNVRPRQCQTASPTRGEGREEGGRGGSALTFFSAGSAPRSVGTKNRCCSPCKRGFQRFWAFRGETTLRFGQGRSGGRNGFATRKLRYSLDDIPPLTGDDSGGRLTG
jgi:hypothetical protein